ncbi:phosphoribosyltransferase-like protein [Psychromonas arctica]|uniref:phosphoribosyltransferase-like protein n=1 Tax=Psychromonas arctica TaxID=168275 RepID=UPI0003FB6A8E|nr:hypothetical protein [Psychromonas arctica]
MTVKQFKIILGLCKKQPWLEDKESELTKLLFTDCKTEDERKLILELLERFVHISHQYYSLLIKELAEAIVTDSLESSSTQIVAMTGDYNTDSAQFVSYGLKPRLEKAGWRNHVSITQFQRAFKTYKASGFVHKDIVLVDEFIGSGKTVIGRVNKLNRMFKDAGYNDVTIRVKTLISSQVGIDIARSSGIDIESLVYLDRGISDYYPSEMVSDKLNLMAKLEGLLSTSYNGRELPNLGYGETECLYTRDDGNTPNSVFPIFWWPFLKDESERDTLLVRAMADA